MTDQRKDSASPPEEPARETEAGDVRTTEDGRPRGVEQASGERNSDG